MTENLLKSIMKDRIEGYDYDFCIENPRGLLRHRPYMVSDDWMECSSRCTMDYCVFDHDYQKPTDFWHSFATDWQPAGCTGDGKCHQKCGKGRIKANGRFQHWKRHAGPAGSGVTGTDQMLQKWQSQSLLNGGIMDVTPLFVLNYIERQCTNVKVISYNPN